MGGENIPYYYIYIRLYKYIRTFLGDNLLRHSQVNHETSCMSSKGSTKEEIEKVRIW